METTPLVTVAVIFHNESERLPKLLDSLKTHIPTPEMEKFRFLFIDNFSSDDSREKLNKKIKQLDFSGTRILERKENHMAQGRQQALEEAKTHWVLFLDADALIQEGWSKNVLRIIDEVEPETHVVGGGEFFIGDKSWHPYAKSLAHYFPMGKQMGKRVVVNHVPTNNYLVRRDKALEAGGFNPFYHRVGEDLDINVRIRKRGNILSTNDFPVRHHLPEELTGWFQKMALYGRAQSYVILENKGGIEKEKFLPLLLFITFLALLISNPISTSVAFTLLLLIPRTQFFTLTFIFYGLGELVGFFRFFVLKMNLKNSASLTDRVS